MSIGTVNWINSGTNPIQKEEEVLQEQLKSERKKASHLGLFYGGLALMAGAVICLIYLLLFKPWKIGGLYDEPRSGPAAKPNPN